MSIKIYYNDKSVFISGHPHPTWDNQEGVLYLPLPTEKDLKKAAKALDDKEHRSIYLLEEDELLLLKKFSEQFQTIEASGGIILNEKKEILFIFRREKWDLPKGKIDDGENEEEAARREIKEETGLNSLILKKKIGNTYHIYEEKGKKIFKTTHWFYFIAEDDQNIQPQAEEGITEIKWFKTKDIRKPIANTYDNIKDILTVFFDTP